ncbi:MAG: hypothetical protein Q9217_002998 [Psora testacea]
MDLLDELSTFDPQIPFRATLHHHHHTWARTFHSYPELYIEPHNISELQKVVTLARRCRRRIALTGCGHSPSDLTCTSSWLVKLDHFGEILDVNKQTNVVVLQAGIRLHDLRLKLRQHGLAMPNLGSIDHQSIAGAIGTATHGSSTRHGILSQSVLALKIMLANGRVVSCAKEQNPELFRAALVSLGALGIITEVTFQAVAAFDIEWAQSLHPLADILGDWEKDLWTAKEFTRVWWMPYMKRCIKWQADKTTKQRRAPASNFWDGKIGFHTYHTLLYVAQWIPKILPLLEKFVMNVQYGFRNRQGPSAVEEGQTGLLMNCLYSQFVNEWAIPLHKGPEAMIRLSAWLNGEEGSGIPFSSKDLYVHAPIEVRVTDTTTTTPRPYLDSTVSDGATLYLNATLYRPYHCDPPCRERYYEAFEWLMKEMGGRPHWAKNFSTVRRDEFYEMYPEMGEWVRIRNEVDPEGMFVGDWHRRLILPDETLPLEERMIMSRSAREGGISWFGAVGQKKLSPQGSEDSFDMVHGVEAEKSIVMDRALLSSSLRKPIFRSLRFSDQQIAPVFQKFDSFSQKLHVGMSRHNRRRTRGGRKASKFSANSFELPSIAESPDSMPLCPQLRPRRIDLSAARLWHNRFLAWQTRERTLKEERQRLRQEQKRIFGGDSQDGEDDDGLCSKMMEYFGGLDYLKD